MVLDKFIDEVFGNILDDEYKEKVKKLVAEGMGKEGFEYEKCQVEGQALFNNVSKDYNLSVSNEGYPDGEIIFLDLLIDEEV